MTLRDHMESYDIIIGGDFNAKLKGYKSRNSNHGGKQIEVLMELAGLKLINNAGVATRREK